MSASPVAPPSTGAVDVAPAAMLPGGGPKQRENYRAAYWYLLPVALSALVFTFAPFLYTLYISFTNYSLTNFVEFNFVGLNQYRRIFATGGEFYPVLQWTLTFMILTTVINVGFGMLLALLLNHPSLPERNIYRTLLIIPWALPFILLAQLWRGIFANNAQAPLNIVLDGIGMGPVQWIPQFGDPTTARAALLLVNLWFTYPFFMTVGLAALQSIPRDLYEVADLDGATWWSRFRDITFPFLLAAIMPLLITQAAFQFNNAGIIILFTAGLPDGAPGANWGRTDTLASYAYVLFYERRSYALSAAYGVVIFAFIATLTVISSIVTKSFKEAD